MRLIDADEAPTVDISGNEYFPFRTAYFNGVKDGRATATPQNKWIPVSERLPEFTGLYLISIDNLVTVANFTGTYFSNRGGVRIVVDAWQPLPKPYYYDTTINTGIPSEWQTEVVEIRKYYAKCPYCEFSFKMETGRELPCFCGGCGRRLRGKEE